MSFNSQKLHVYYFCFVCKYGKYQQIQKFTLKFYLIKFLETNKKKRQTRFNIKIIKNAKMFKLMNRTF